MNAVGPTEVPADLAPAIRTEARPGADAAAEAEAEAERDSGRWARAPASVAFVVASAAIVLLRQPGMRPWDTVWAEDGGVYAHDATSGPLLHTLVSPYAGYLQLVPRVLAVPTRVLPVAGYAAWFAGIGAVATGLLGLVVVHSARGWITNRALRWLTGLLLVTAPTAAYEIDANVVNLNWPLLAASFWVVVSRRRGRTETALRVAVVLVAALSTPLTAALLPVAALVAVVRRTRDDIIVLVALGIGLGVQALVVLTAHDGVPRSGSDYGQATHSFFVRVVGSAVVGQRWLSDLYPARGWLLVIGSLTVLAVLVGLSAPRLDLDRAWLVGAAGATAVGMYALTAIVRGTDSVPLLFAGAVNNADSRYVYGPIFLVLSAVVVLVDGSGRDWLKGLVAVWLVAVTVSSLGLANGRSAGPSWATGVRRAQAACRQHPSQLVVRIPTSPDPWYDTVDCSRLR